MKVPFFNYPDVYLSDRDRFIEIFDSVCSKGAFILQEDLHFFEKELAEFAGVKYALGLGNATDALLLLYLAAGVTRGDEVLFCSHTMTATVAPLSLIGATPIPVEVGRDRTIDVESARSKVTEKTKAIIPTQLNGRVTNMDAVMAFAKEHDLIVLEDSAQALGAQFKGKGVGSFGLGGVISFYPAKTLGCFGDGGAILTNDSGMHERIGLLRDHGRDKDGETVCWGYNTRLDTVQAAFLRHKLKSFPEVIKRRRAIAGMYQEQLGGLSQLELPLPPDAGDHFDTFQNYEVVAERRDELKSFLAEREVGTIIQWGGKAVHQIEALQCNASLPATEKFFAGCLLLPLNASLTDEDVAYVCEQIRAFYS